MLTIYSVRTSQQITEAIREIVGSFNDAPRGLEHISQEYNSVQAVVSQLGSWINHPDRSGNGDEEMTAQARTIIAETQVTLDELFHIIRQLIPENATGSKRRAVRVGCSFLWNEKKIQVTMLRLQGKRDALSMIMSLWGR
jgi:hypothetical protein